MIRASDWGVRWNVGDGIRMGIATVTPEMAKEYLANEVYTRGSKPNLVRRYATNMARNAWFLNGETIVFNTQGQGIEGHNRCMACIAAGVPFATIVVFGIEQRAAISINCGGPRNLSTRVSAEKGVQSKTNRVTLLTRLLQIDRATIDMTSYPTHLQASYISADVINEVNSLYQEAVDFVLGHFKTRKVHLCNASTMAAAVKAYYHTRRYPGGRSRLSEFCSILNSGMPIDVSRDKAVLVLREHLANTEKSKKGKSSHDQGIPIFLKTVYCLDKFMSGLPINAPLKAKVDLFPLPTPAESILPRDQDLFDRVEKAIADTVVAEPNEA